MARNLVLHMGYLNTPYTDKVMSAPMHAARVAIARKLRRGYSKTTTAEDVGNILETNYNILEVFNEIHNEEIMDPIVEAASEMARDVIVESGLSERRKFSSEKMVRYMKPKTKEIEKMFRSFLDMEEMNGQIGPSGLSVPTQASLTGKGRRTKRPGHSFIDTGVLRAAFAAWADIK
jgi:hypothetical protein